MRFPSVTTSYDAQSAAMIKCTFNISVLLAILLISPASAEVRVVNESKERIQGLCSVKSNSSSLEGLTNVIVQKNINRILSKEVNDQFTYYLSTFENDSFCTDGLGIEINIGTKTHLLSDALISISIQTTSYGGVHPWYDAKTYNLDPSTGRIYSLRELMSEETIIWLIQRIEQQIERDKHQRVEDLDAIGKSEFEERLETFYINSDEMVFDFNTVLFGHATGPTIVTVKLTELFQKLTRDSILLRLKKDAP